MQKIYNELKKYDGKLLQFADHLVEIGLYSSERTAREAIRHNVRPIEEVTKAYEQWKVGRLRTKDMETHKEKLSTVFKEIKVRTVKAECESILEVLEEALMLLTLSAKKQDLTNLPEIKRLLEEALYGRK